MTLLLVDGGFACHRAFHATGFLTNDDIQTGVPFGVFQSLALWIQTFGTDRVMWFFDQGQSIRATMLPSYKHSRTAAAAKDPQKATERRMVHAAIKDMATKWLPLVGYAAGNICYQKHYEADDLIAAACSATKERCIIISADSDLLQMLRLPHVNVYNPAARPTGKLWDCDTFEFEKGVLPEEWPLVKSIVGDDSDDIPGVAGVGDKGAVQYVQGELKPHLEKYKAVKRAEACGLIDRNLRLTTLPWPGTMAATYSPDHITPESWDAFCTALGCSDGSIPFPKVPSDVIER